MSERQDGDVIESTVRLLLLVVAGFGVFFLDRIADSLERTEAILERAYPETPEPVELEPTRRRVR